MTTQPIWLDKDEYPFESKFITQDKTVQHYIDEGQGEPIVFVHGTPSWSFDFRKIIKDLSSDFRCVAPDHIGFGLSQKPEHYDYSLAAHTGNLQNLIYHLDLKNCTLVLHDFGGPIGLEYALKFPENIKRLIIINSWIGSAENDAAYKRMKRILKSPLLPFLYLNFNFSAAYLMPSAFGNQKMSRFICKHYTRPFPNKSSRYGTLAFAKSLLTDQDFFESQLMRSSLLNKIPMLLIWGMKDKFVGEHFLEKFETAFPHASSVRLQDAGHFPQEEEPDKVLQAIKSFLT